MPNKAIQYRLYPNDEQSTYFAKAFGCCRKIWNLMLADKEAYYNVYHVILPTTPAAYKKDYPYLKEIDSLALANVQLQLERAYKSCYKDRLTEAPKFKSKHRDKKSYTTNCQRPKGKRAIWIHDNMIHLPKVGDVKVKIHRAADASWRLKSVTVSQDKVGDYFVSVLYEYEADVKPVSLSNALSALGLDYKSDGLYMDDTGHCARMPKYFRESQKQLAKAQRVLSRRQGSRKGETKSKNWRKAQKRVNKIYRHIANERKDYLHKLSKQLADQYDVICVETLDMKAMSNKGFGNGKATMDNGYGMFLAMLSYKLADQGKYLVKIDKWYPSSQTCHTCGHKQKMPLDQRTYVCPECGMIMDRDINAAINIKKEGLRQLLAV